MSSDTRWSPDCAAIVVSVGQAVLDGPERPQVVPDGTRWSPGGAAKVIPGGFTTVSGCHMRSQVVPGGTAKVVPDGLEQSQMVLRGSRWSSGGAIKEIPDGLNSPRWTSEAPGGCQLVQRQSSQMILRSPRCP